MDRGHLGRGAKPTRRRALRESRSAATAAEPRGLEARAPLERPSRFGSLAQTDRGIQTPKENRAAHHAAAIGESCSTKWSAAILAASTRGLEARAPLNPPSRFGVCLSRGNASSAPERSKQNSVGLVFFQRRLQRGPGEVRMVNSRARREQYDGLKKSALELAMRGSRAGRCAAGQIRRVAT